MTVKAQIVLIAIFLCGLILIINAVRKKKLQLKYALPWIVCIVVLTILTAIPGVIQWLADLVGIYSPVNLIFFLGFLFFLCVAFVQVLALSKTTAQLRQLTQSVALLEKRLQEKDDKTKE